MAIAATSGRGPWIPRLDQRRPTAIAVAEMARCSSLMRSAPHRTDARRLALPRMLIARAGGKRMPAHVLPTKFVGFPTNKSDRQATEYKG
ncbi:hypothetical protein GCM10011320_05820 [Neoroseomonas lacus]|uniref:Uncharacterized protein n=1 Tax=Neoroseomonas lacus TaxID=287609 RepID=A0A917K8Q8_9PROT|nr:hypothetical protein GCM10011320_05820 [Neoroseomonas lacus]